MRAALLSSMYMYLELNMLYIISLSKDKNISFIVVTDLESI